MSAEIAWQKQIRDRRAADNSDADLFGNWWVGIDHDIRKADVREIDIPTARAIILDYEWLGTMPAIVRHCFGIFFEGNLAGAVVYSPEYSENLGVWERYGYAGKMILLSRGACVHWAHPHAASKLIRASMRLLPGHYDVVTATVDANANEIGTIYQACGFDYVGLMSKGGKRVSYKIGDVRKSARQAKRDFGSTGERELERLGVGGIETHDRIHRYFAFRGPPSVQRRNRRAIAHKIKPFPKRAARPDDAPAPTGVSQVQPLGAAPQ